MVTIERKLSVLNVAVITTIVLAGFIFTWYFFYDTSHYYFKGNILLILCYFLSFEAIMHLADGYSFQITRISSRIINQSAVIIFLNVVFYFIISLTARQLVDCIPLLLETFLVLTILFIWVNIFRLIENSYINTKQLLFLYSSDKELNIVKKFNRHKNRYNIKDMKLLTPNVAKSFNFDFIKNYDGVLIGHIDKDSRNKLIKYCYTNNLFTLMVPNIPDIIIRYGNEFKLIDTPILTLASNKITIIELLCKRLADIILSGIATVVLSPIFLIVAIAIKINDRGPVIYKQKRYTKGKKIFEIYKFRSMIVNAEKVSGHQLSTENDGRITKVGKVIRTLRLDELPQLINIFKGDMSIVGPRPERPDIAEQYESYLPEFAYRTEVKAGLTGLAQVQGRYNTTPYDKLRLDLFYINHYSLLLDLKLMFLTVPALFIKENTEGIEEGKKTAGE